jgi:WD40 repeat protein
VFSCSKAGKICLYELTFDGHGRVIAGAFVKSLDGHRGLVDRCCVFDGDTRMISASWDKTCKIWDLETATCLHTCKDDNKVRGVAVYDNDTKAVCCGSGQWLSVWDISTGLLLNRVDMQHGRDRVGALLDESDCAPASRWRLERQPRCNHVQR